MTRRTSALLLSFLSLAASSAVVADVDLRDAVKNGQMTVEAHGTGDTDSLTLTLASSLPSVDVAVAAGTFFSPKCPWVPGGKVQPMVIVKTVHVHVTGRLTVKADANCADLNADVPKPEDILFLCEAPAGLDALVACLEANPTSYGQYVIWTFMNDFCGIPPGFLTPDVLEQIRRSLETCRISTSDKCLFDTSLFVSIVLSSAGANGSFFTTELTLTNRSAARVALTFEYESAFGGGSGEGRDELRPGEQKIVPDAIAYLKSVGVPIPGGGDRGGTLRVSSAGVAAGELAVTARTTTAVAGGAAGLAYAGLSRADRLNGPSFLVALRQDELDRSNVALQNAGTALEGDVTLRLTVFSGDVASPSATVLPDVTLAPGGFRQISNVLVSNGLSLKNGYIRVDRVSGRAPYVAYAVINDQANSDGSFVAAVTADGASGATTLALPVVVETSAFGTELVATNSTILPKTLHLTFVADAIQSPDHSSSFVLTLAAGEQRILPDFVALMRQTGAAGLGPPGPVYAGALFAESEDGDLSGVFLGARVSTPGGGGRYGLFFLHRRADVPGLSVWISALQQNAQNRTNLALVNLGNADGEPDLFDIELYDGSTGARVATVGSVSLPARGWRQFNAILAQYASGATQGYARIVRTRGQNAFLAYAVVNDGGAPGQRSGDGAFVWGIP